MTEDLRLRDQARSAMAPFLQRLAGKPEVIGVAVLSSAAIGQQETYFDAESDFDVSILVRSPGWHPGLWRPEPTGSYRLMEASIPPWSPNFLFRVAVPWGQLEVNVHQLVVEYEADRRTTWDHEKCDAYVYKCELVYDPAGEFARLIQTKAGAAWQTTPQLIRRLANRLTWDIRRVPLVAAQRLGPAVAHELVNHAVDELIQLVYLLNGRFVTARKWRLITLLDAGLLSATAWERLVAALYAENGSAEDLERRIDLVDGLWHDLCGSFGLPDARTLRRQYQASDLQLLHRTVADQAVDACPDPAVFSAANLGLWDRVPSQTESPARRPR